MVRAPGKRVGVRPQTGFVADPPHPEHLVCFTDVARRPCLGDVGRQPQSGGSRALERAHVRRQVRKEQLVTGDVEPDDAVPRPGCCRSCKRGVRFLVMVSQRTDDHACRDPGRPRSVGRAFAYGCDHGIDGEPGPYVGERPEPELQVRAAVSGRILDRFARDPGQGTMRAEQRVGRRDVGEEDGQVARRAHHECLVPARCRRLHPFDLRKLGGRLQPDAALEVRVKVDRDHQRSRRWTASRATAMLCSHPVCSRVFGAP